MCLKAGAFAKPNGMIPEQTVYLPSNQKVREYKLKIRAARFSNGARHGGELAAKDLNLDKLTGIS
jgi:hypothetical protein